jgi:hypothetical protein
MTNLCPSCREPLDYPSGDGCAAMTKHHIETAIELLERIAGHDHQAAIIRIFTNQSSCPFERLEAYADCLNEVANTDIQGWAQMALLHLRGENEDD